MSHAGLGSIQRLPASCFSLCWEFRFFQIDFLSATCLLELHLILISWQEDATFLPEHDDCTCWVCWWHYKEWQRAQPVSLVRAVIARLQMCVQGIWKTRQSVALRVEIRAAQLLCEMLLQDSTVLSCVHSTALVFLGMNFNLVKQRKLFRKDPIICSSLFIF